jgi:chloride channel protein, CIC family
MLMIGGALGGLEATVFPHVAPGFWPLIGIAGVLGGLMRSPLTGVLFAVELTHRYEALLPLLIGATAAYAVSVLVLRRSVLTEKVARRGVHISREYSVDPLEVLFVGDVMSDGVGAAGAASEGPVVYADDTLRHVAYVMAESGRTVLPVGERDRPEQEVGSIGLDQLLAGRLQDLKEERHRSRPLRPIQMIGQRRAAAAEAVGR